jgi:hypothetical protein
MSRGAQNFRQADLVKAVKALMKAGLSVGRIEIAEGKIILMTNQPEANGSETTSDVNEWDSVK